MDGRSISVVIPTYNCASLLGRAILSAYNQTLTPLEVIVVNDGCTDDTEATVAALRSTLPDSLVYLKKPNGGEASARNHGIAAARGELVAFLDQDDTWYPQKLERQVEVLERDPATDLVFTACVRRDGESDTVVQLSEWEPSVEAAVGALLDGCCIVPSTVIVRRQLLDQVGPFDESLWLGSDWDMWFRMALGGHRIVYLREPLIDYYRHDTNMSNDRRKIAEAALTLLPRVFGSECLAPSLRRRKRRFIAKWQFLRACSLYEAGECRSARSALRRAAVTRPLSVRPGWVRLYLRSWDRVSSEHSHR